MRTQPALAAPQQSTRSWGAAYKRFLLSRDESFILKVAPLLLLIGTPGVIVSNLLPVIGEVIDLGDVTLILIVALLTYRAVRKYR